jgi:hypothetical protein
VFEVASVPRVRWGALVFEVRHIPVGFGYVYRSPT